MSRLDLAEIVAAVLDELDRTPATGLTRGPGGRPEVPMRRPPSGAAPQGATSRPVGDQHATLGAAGRRAPLPDTPGEATPPVTVAEAMVCAPRRRTDRDAASTRGDASTGGRVGAPRGRPTRPSATAETPAPAAARPAPDVVERIVADLRRRLDDSDRE